MGYKQNDVFTDYLDMNQPKQLTAQQVDTLKKNNNGAPIATATVSVDAKGILMRDFDLHENDVFLLKLVKR